jgi:TolA-binding protein
VYRATEPVRNTTALTQQNLAADLPAGTSYYADKVTDAKSYYYAVIALYDGEAFKLIVPSVNATVRSASVVPNSASSLGEAAAQAEKVPGNRSLPLPSLNETPSAKPALTKESSESALALASPARSAHLEPYIFPQEQIENKSGESFLLYEIISGAFASKQYDDANQKLTEFLRIKRGAEITQRALFYQGECGYFLGDYRAAVNNFMNTKASYPELSSRWLEASLSEVKIPQ